MARILAVPFLLAASHAYAGSQEAMEWIDRGDCKRAGEEINKGIELNEPRAYFLAGFLFDATGCVDQDLKQRWRKPQDRMNSEQ